MSYYRVTCVNSLNENDIHEFDSLKQAGKFLIEQGYPGNNHRRVIKRYADNDEPYCGYYWDVTSQDSEEEGTSTPATTTSTAIDLILNDGQSDVKLRVTNETPKRVSVFDLISSVTHNANPHSTFEDLCKRYPEVIARTDHFLFQGQGQRPTPVTDVHGVVMIINLLPGETAARFRQKSAEILVRYLGGDETLINEVRANRALQETLPENHPMKLFNITSPTMRDKYLDDFINKKIVYIITFVIANTMYIKFGRSENSVERMKEHLRTYPNAEIYCIYEVNEPKLVEDALKSKLKYRGKLTDITINNRRFIEIAQHVAPEDVESMLLSIIEEKSDSVKDLELKHKELDIQLRTLELSAKEKELEIKKGVVDIVRNGGLNSPTLSELQQLLTSPL